MTRLGQEQAQKSIYSVLSLGWYPRSSIGIINIWNSQHRWFYFCVSKVPYKTEEEHPESLGVTAKWDSNKTDGDATWAKVQCGSSLQKTPFEAVRTLRSTGRAEFHWDSPATQSPPPPNIRDRQAWSSSLKALRVKWWEWFGMKYRREKVTVKDIFTC